MVDLEQSRITQIDARRVRVEGSRLQHADAATIKLEGVALRGYRAVTIAGMTDPLLIAAVDEVEKRVRDTVAKLMKGTLDPDRYELNFIYYGRDGVRPTAAAPGHELGLVIDAIAPTQDLANTVLSLARSSYLHGFFEGRKATAGNLAFPFSPSDLEAGPVYEFTAYHLMEVDDADSLFPIRYSEVLQ
jgi:hypothetical protein